jgi:hypothetical protein
MSLPTTLYKENVLLENYSLDVYKVRKLIQQYKKDWDN